MTGGTGAERSISLNSATVVCNHLSKDKYEVYKVFVDGFHWKVEKDDRLLGEVDKNDFSFFEEGSKKKFDAAFVAIHGTPAEDGKLMGYFDLLQIPYNCCSVATAALTFDKNRTKEYLSAFGVLSPAAILGTKVNRPQLEDQITSTLQFPIFIKPNKNGSSYGASKVNSPGEVAKAVELAFEYDDEILAEEYIAGTEVTCGCICLNGKTTVLPITEIRSKKGFFDFEAKYQGASQEITPAEIDAAMTAAIQKTVGFIYDKLDFKGMCRIDFIISNGKYYMLEVNSIPGISAESIVPQQAKVFGLSLSELFEATLQPLFN